jgi:hypothetical protein
MSRRVIFQELCVIGRNIIQLIPFVHAFYPFEFPLYSHYNHEAMSQLAHLPWELVKVILMEGHYLLEPILRLYVL